VNNMYCRESYIKLSQHPAHKMLEISSGNEGNSVKSFMLLYVDNTFDKKYHFGSLKCKLFEITTFWTFPLLEKCQRQISTRHPTKQQRSRSYSFE
jgi:hypothetical protein